MIWLTVGIFGIIFSYVYGLVAFTFRFFGAFAIVMMFISYGFMFVKDSNPKISQFLSPVIIIALWSTIIFPYVILIPTLSVYTDQTNFGNFIYYSILGSVVLMIFLVGVISMIFNILMNKF